MDGLKTKRFLMPVALFLFLILGLVVAQESRADECHTCSTPNQLCGSCLPMSGGGAEDPCPYWYPGSTCDGNCCVYPGGECGCTGGEYYCMGQTYTGLCGEACIGTTSCTCESWSSCGCDGKQRRACQMPWGGATFVETRDCSPSRCLDLNGSCNSSGSISLSWTNEQIEYSSQKFRIDETSNNSSSATWGWYVSDPPDFYKDSGVSGTSYTYPSGVLGKPYHVWLHEDTYLGYGAWINLTADDWFSCPAAIANDSQCISMTGVPTSVTAGGTFTAQATVKNSGTKTWNSDSSPHRLGSANNLDNWTWGLNRVGLPVSTVAPGAQTTFNISATAPSTPGTYSFSWRMVEDAVEWFGPVCSSSSSVTVTAPSYSCTGTIPANATMFAGDNTGLTANTPYSYWPTDTGTKCQYSCNSGFIWDDSNSTCKLIPPAPTISASCGAGSMVSSSWNAVSGADFYAFRLNDTSNGWPICPPDVMINTFSLSHSYAGVPGGGYGLWVHSCINKSNGSYLTCGSAGAVNVTCPLLPTLSFTSSDYSVNENESFTLSWTATNATSCTASGQWSGAKASTGTLSTSIPNDGFYTYSLACTNGVGDSISKNVDITVLPPMPGECSSLKSSCAQPKEVDRCNSAFGSTTPTLSSNLWSWTCLGLNGGAPATCTARKECPWTETNN